MSIIRKSLLNKADYLANEYNTARYGADRDQIKAEWYKEVKRVATEIQTHRKFLQKK